MGEEELGPRQRAAETKRRRTREAIVNGTIDLYGEQQQGDYTLDQIGEAAGVSAATIANHYQSKYEVLKTAHERLLLPLVDTILEAAKAEVYQPKDGVDELVRYVYTAARISQEHRALTTAMVKAYFELIPAFMSTAFDGEPYAHEKRPVGDYIAAGLWHILRLESFRGDWFDIQRNSLLRPLPVIVGDTILMELWRKPGEGVATNITYEMCRLVLNVTLHEDHDDSLRERIDRIKRQS